MDKVLGILGGMGPLATVKLFERIVLNTNAYSDQEHIHILIDNNTKIPSRPDYILDHSKENPKYELISSAKNLETMGAEFLIMPCNTAHYFYDDIVKEINIPFISMIEITLEYIEDKHPNIKKVGLISTVGTIEAKIYDDIFQNSNIQVLKPETEDQKHVTKLIKNIKQGKKPESLDNFNKTISDMKNSGIELFIAGCTEISVALELYELRGEFIDPLNILSNRAIEFSGKIIKDET